jgi:hypothetical protein
VIFAICDWGWMESPARCAQLDIDQVVFADCTCFSCFAG